MAARSKTSLYLAKSLPERRASRRASVKASSSPRLTTSVLAILWGLGCGHSSSKKSSPAPSPAPSSQSPDPTNGDTASYPSGSVFTEDATVLTIAASTALDESLASLAEETKDTSSTSLALMASVARGVKEQEAPRSASLFAANFHNTTVSSSCAVQEMDAYVTITASAQDQSSRSTANFSLVTELSGSDSATRSWSLTSGSVACDSSGSYASIDWSKVAGLNLAGNFNRTRQKLSEVTHLSSGATTTQSFSYSAAGSRQLSWLTAIPSLSIAGSYLRELYVNLSSTQKTTVQSSTGIEIDYTFLLNTIDGSPLDVIVERDSSSNAPIAKTFARGAIELWHQKNHLTATFNNFIINYNADQSCFAQSGDVSLQVFNGSATTPAASYTISCTSGECTKTNTESGASEDFFPTSCDPADLAG